tara:strand:- start:5969 stop:7510 length:1542 start_codon:yes stop_codon:yes gene_type:complete
MNISKTAAVQGSPYSATKNLIDFVIDADQLVDIKNSYVNINVSVLEKDVESNASCFYDSSVVLDDNSITTNIFRNSALVRNADLYSQKLGMVESVQDINLYEQTLNIYTKDENEKIETLYDQNSGSKEINNILNSNCRLLKTSGDVSAGDISENLDHDLKIPLKEFLGCAKTGQLLDTGRLGQCKLHLELQFGNLKVTTARGATDPVWSADTRDKSTFNIVANATGAAINLGTDIGFVTTKKYNDPRSESPFYLGQKLTIAGRNGTTAGGTGSAAYAVATNAGGKYTITKIVVNFDGSLTIFTDLTVIALANNNSYFPPAAGDSQGSSQGVDPSATAGDSSVVINSCELVTSSPVNPNPLNQNTTMTFQTVSTEHDTGNNLTNFTKMYTLEPQCTAVMVANPAANESVLSNIQYTSYRNMIDQIHTTNRDIKRGTPLEKDRQHKYFKQIGQPLKSYKQTIRKNTLDDSSNEAEASNAIFEICDMTENHKQFHLNIVSGGLNQFILYKNVTRTL